MKLSFSTRGWPNLSFDEMLDVASDMGFSGVEVYNLTKFDPLMDKGGPFHKYNISATVRKLRERGITIPCFDTSLDISSDESAPSPVAIALLEGV
jgi:fatty-acyl-CoA synthase